MKRFAIVIGEVVVGEGIVFTDGRCAYIRGTASDFLPSLRELRERHPKWQIRWIDSM
jgi:hypothetical protein